MGSNRREFLRRSAAALAGIGVLGRGSPLLAGEEAPAGAEGKRLLILGGTSFLGPQIVAAAREGGWTITLFNRGKTNPHLFPDLEKLRGDRDGDLGALKGRRFDVVVDTSGYIPRHVRDSATLLKDAVNQYMFVSTISVYAEGAKSRIDETSPVGKLDDETVEQVTGGSYGPLKALCERAAETAMPGRVTVVRPGLIVGPGDPTDRFTYWPVRVGRGGEVLAPGSPADPVQFIDVRDLAEWIVRVAGARTTGVFNATGPKDELGIGALLETCKTGTSSEATFTWVDAAFLEKKEVSPWSDMPLWVPPGGDLAAFARVSSAKAIAKGLTFRPVVETVRATWEWWKEQPEERRRALRSGIKPEAEAGVLAAWHKQQAKG